MNLISTFYGEIYKDFKIDNFKQKWSNGQGGGGGGQGEKGREGGREREREGGREGEKIDR